MTSLEHSHLQRGRKTKGRLHLDSGRVLLLLLQDKRSLLVASCLSMGELGVAVVAHKERRNREVIFVVDCRSKLLFVSSVRKENETR